MQGCSLGFREGPFLRGSSSWKSIHDSCRPKVTSTTPIPHSKTQHSPLPPQSSLNPSGSGYGFQQRPSLESKLPPVILMSPANGASCDIQANPNPSLHHAFDYSFPFFLILYWLEPDLPLRLSSMPPAPEAFTSPLSCNLPSPPAPLS